MKRIIIVLALLLTLVLALPSFAKTRKNHGIFVDGAVGWGRINESISGINRRDNTGFAWNVNGGYRFNRFWALEAGYYDFPDNSFRGGIHGSDNYAYALDIKAIVPFDNGFNIIGKAGVAYSYHDLRPRFIAGGRQISGAGSTSGTAMLLGLGLSYSLTPHLDVALQGTGITHNGDVPAKIMTTLGLTYTF